jgi:hypothetical protein
VERERRKRIRVGPQQEIDVIPVTFQASGENWNEYLLSDGTVLKIKMVATEIYRLPDVYDPDGNPQYIVRSANVVATSSPDNLRQQGG